MSWRCFQASVLVLPLFPAMGAVGLVFVLVNLWSNCYRQILRNPLNWALAIVSVSLIINCTLAVHPQESWLGLANFLPYFALFAALCCLINNIQQLEQLSWLLIIPSLPIVILGLGQMWANWSSPQLISDLLGWQLVAEGIPAGRMSSVFIYANFLAIYLAIAFSLALGLWLKNWQVWRQKHNYQQSLLLFSLTAIIIADVIGLILTSSRNAWGITFLSFMAFAIYLSWYWLVWLVTGIATAIGWASFAPHLGGTWLRQIVPAFLWARLSDQMYPDRPVATLRITQWQFCWDLITERPIFGWGIRNFTPLYEAKMNVWFGHPHNFWLMFAAETGIINTLLLSGIVAVIFAKTTMLLSNICQVEARQNSSNGLIFFSYLIAFGNCILFNLFDVTIFDLRINLISWILLSAISGVSLNREFSRSK